jgi:hypothetical protein
MGIFGTDGGCRRGNINCPSFGDRNYARTEDGTNGTSGVCVLPIGGSFGFGNTKFVPTVVDASTVFFGSCERVMMSVANGTLGFSWACIRINYKVSLLDASLSSKIGDVPCWKPESSSSSEDVSEVIIADSAILACASQKTIPTSYHSNISSGFTPLPVSQNQDFPSLVVALVAEPSALNLIHSRALASAGNDQSIRNTIENAIDVFSRARNNVRYSTVVAFAIEVKSYAPTL